MEQVGVECQSGCAGPVLFLGATGRAHHTPARSSLKFNREDQLKTLTSNRLPYEVLFAPSGGGFKLDFKLGNGS